MKTTMHTALTLVVLLGLLLPACGTPAAPEPTAATTPEQPPATAPPEATTAPEPEATPAPASEIKRGGTLRIGYEVDFQSLDPAHHMQHADTVIFDLVYEGLVRWDLETLEPRPLLAKSWEISDDGLAYTFHLEEGVKWHNGTELTAEDVKYSFERLNDPDVGSALGSLIGPIESVEVVGKHTLVVYLSEPFSPLLSLLPYIPSIVNKEFVEAEGGTTPRTTMGTGPFMLDEWLPDEVLRLKANPNYWRLGEDGQPLPYVDAIEFYPLVDETARVDALLSGAVDFIVRVPDAMAEMLEADPDIELSATWTTEWFNVMMDTNTPPWDDVRVRQAVSLAIDRDAVVETVCYGRGTPLYGGIIPSWHWAYSDLQTYRYQDLEKARQLLAEAGYPDGLDVTLGTATGFDFVIRLAEVVAAMLEEAGIRAEIEMSPVAEYFDSWVAGECKFCIGGESPAGDPDDFYFVYFHSEGDFNYNSYSNPQLDRLLEEGRQVSDLQQRKQIYRQVEEIVLQEVPFAHVVSPVAQEAYASYLKGYVHMGNRRLHGLMYTWLDQ